MRFNSAPTRGFEKHAGSKTTHRITNTQNWAYREYLDETLLVHMRSQASLKAYVKTRGCDKSVRMAAFDSDFVNYMASGMAFMPTSGLYGIVIALQRCAKVDLYGFQVSTAQGAAAYHYYNQCDQPANNQRDGAEWFMVKAFVDAGVARFAEPCVAECHEGKDVCMECKRAEGFPEVTLPKRTCPKCSFAYGGCRPPNHWAFGRGRRGACPFAKQPKEL